MALYSLAQRTSSGTNAAAAAELRASSTVRLRVRQISITLGAATASIFGIGRPAAIGVTPTSPVSGLPLDPADTVAAAGQGAVAWGTGPTVPPQFLARIGFPAAIGNGWIWTFDPGSELVVPLSGSIVVWNLATNGVADVTWTWWE